MITPALSRRTVLKSLPAALGLSPAAHRLTFPAADPEALRQLLTREASYVHFELCLYQQVLVPLLLRRPRVAGQWGHGLVAPDRKAVRAYRQAAERLKEARIFACSPDDFDPEPLFADAFPFMHASARLQFFQKHAVDASFVEKRCTVKNDRLIWNCSYLGSPCDSDDLDTEARRVLWWLLPEEKLVTDPLARLRAIPHHRLLHELRGMHGWMYYYLVPQLFRFIPNTPADVFAIPLHTPHMWNCPRSAMERCRHDPWLRSVVSYLMCTSMGILASNNFCRVPRLARRPEIEGNWLDFMPAQLLDVLYQKVVVLNYLRT